jgi:hypothetical protein
MILQTDPTLHMQILTFQIIIFHNLIGIHVGGLVFFLEIGDTAINIQIKMIQGRRFWTIFLYTKATGGGLLENA